MYFSTFLMLMKTPANVPNLYQKAKLILTNKKEFYQRVWDAKDDKEIREAYKDNVDSRKQYRSLELMDTTMEKRSEHRWETYIKPQVIKRNLELDISI
jgi:hypothetical protein